jgi:hypothetical protein
MNRVAAFAFLVAIGASLDAFGQDSGPGRGAPAQATVGGSYLIEHDGAHYWYDQGHWYRKIGLGWRAVDAPVGAFVPALPPDYATVSSGGMSYYRADDTYYRWNGEQRAYEVMEPPAAIDSNG